jgi:hypothetical protein
LVVVAFFVEIIVSVFSTCSCIFPHSWNILWMENFQIQSGNSCKFPQDACDMYLIWINKGLESIYFIWLFVYVISIPKHVITTLVDVISFAKIIADVNFKCISLTFCKLNYLAFIVFIFNMPCGSIFMGYFNR